MPSKSALLVFQPVTLVRCLYFPSTVLPRDSANILFMSLRPTYYTLQIHATFTMHLFTSAVIFLNRTAIRITAPPVAVFSKPPAKHVYFKRP